ncbi:MAG: hypothetical protein H7338_05115 [Candidatus Sericytochromatia bacterium]|nr:hypothetical protein [Candidatus Sericytochromatia bacterium]
MAVMSLNIGLDTIRSMQVAGPVAQRAFTDAVAHDASVLVNAVIDLDIASVRRRVATGILAALR